jgi:hypothetical protein
MSRASSSSFSANSAFLQPLDTLAQPAFEKAEGIERESENDSEAAGDSESDEDVATIEVEVSQPGQLCDERRQAPAEPSPQAVEDAGHERPGQDFPSVDRLRHEPMERAAADVDRESAQASIDRQTYPNDSDRSRNIRKMTPTPSSVEMIASRASLTRSKRPALTAGIVEAMPYPTAAMRSGFCS